MPKPFTTIVPPSFKAASETYQYSPAVRIGDQIIVSGIVGYIVIAMQDSQHYVADDQLVEIQVAATSGASELWRVPEVLFTRT